MITPLMLLALFIGGGLILCVCKSAQEMKQGSDDFTFHGDQGSGSELPGGPVRRATQPRRPALLTPAPGGRKIHTGQLLKLNPRLVS